MVDVGQDPLIGGMFLLYMKLPVLPVGCGEKGCFWEKSSSVSL